MNTFFFFIRNLKIIIQVRTVIKLSLYVFFLTSDCSNFVAKLPISSQSAEKQMSEHFYAVVAYMVC